MIPFVFFFNDTATTEIYTLSLHDALPIYCGGDDARAWAPSRTGAGRGGLAPAPGAAARQPGACDLARAARRSEEHTSELQSRLHLVCRLLLEKKKKTYTSRLSAESPR